MITYNQEIINIVEKICDMFNHNEIDLMTDEQRNVFASELNTNFNVLYDTFKNIPGSLKKNEILKYIRDKQDALNIVSFWSTGVSMDYVKALAHDMRKYLIDNLDAISIDDDRKKYLSKLAIYNNAIDRHMELEKNYKKGNIKYDMYIGSYNTLVLYYKDIMDNYKRLADDTIERPKRLMMIPKSVDDLLIKDMKQEHDDYLKLCNFYEGEIYYDYTLALEKYDNNEISREDYEVAASNCLNHYTILNNEYKRLNKQFLEYEKMFDSEINDYIMVTLDELNSFYAALDEYNKLVNKYKEESDKLDRIVYNGVLDYEEYERQLFTLDELYNKLFSRRDKLKKQREKIYNNMALNILRKRKKNIEYNLKNSNLTDQGRQRLSDDLKNVNEHISEINRFKSTLVIKSFKKTEKVRKRNDAPKRNNSNNDTNYVCVNRLNEPVFLGANNVKLLVNGNNNYGELLAEYNNINEEYNKQLYLFYEITKKFLRGEIPYEGEYEKSALNVIAVYNNVKKHYDKVEELYQKDENKQQLESPKIPEKPMISVGKEEKIEKVVRTKIWKWVNSHKKQILIAFGLMLLAVSVIVLVTQLMSAIMVAAQASQAAGMFSQMILNANAWHSAILSERIALHGANIALANQITTLTGMSSVYNTATGVWTIGGNVLANAATQASIGAGKAAKLVTMLKFGTLIPAIGGLGLVGAGLLSKNSGKKRIRKNTYELNEGIE